MVYINIINITRHSDFLISWTKEWNKGLAIMDKDKVFFKNRLISFWFNNILGNARNYQTLAKEVTSV